MLIAKYTYNYTIIYDPNDIVTIFIQQKIHYKIISVFHYIIITRTCF